MGGFSALRNLSIGPLPGTAQPTHPIDDLGTLESTNAVQELHLMGLHALPNLTGIENLPLHTLTISDCTALEDLRGLSWQSEMHTLHVTQCLDHAQSYSHLTDLRPIRGLKALQKLRLDGLSNLVDISPLSELKQITELQIHDAGRLADLDPIASLKTLEQLSFSRLPQLCELQSISTLPQLKRLSITHCTDIQNTKGLRNLPALRLLDLRGCTGIDKLELDRFPTLETLLLTGCNQLEEVFSLAAVPSLRHLSLSSQRDSCMDGISSCTQLETLVLDGEGIDNLDFMEDLESLQSLHLTMDFIGDVAGIRRAPSLQTVHVGRAQLKQVKMALSERPDIEVQDGSKTDH